MGRSALAGKARPVAPRARAGRVGEALTQQAYELSSRRNNLMSTVGEHRARAPRPPNPVMETVPVPGGPEGPLLSVEDSTQQLPLGILNALSEG